MKLDRNEIITIGIVIVLLFVVFGLIAQYIPFGETHSISGYVLNVDIAGGFGWSQTTVYFNHTSIRFVGTPLVRIHTNATIEYQKAILGNRNVLTDISYGGE